MSRAKNWAYVILFPAPACQPLFLDYQGYHFPRRLMTVRSRKGTPGRYGGSFEMAMRIACSERTAVDYFLSPVPIAKDFS
jgi:hypothetical protein